MHSVIYILQFVTYTAYIVPNINLPVNSNPGQNCKHERKIFQSTWVIKEEIKIYIIYLG